MEPITGHSDIVEPSRIKSVTVILYIFLIALAVIYVAPLLWMLSVSLKDNAGVMAAFSIARMRWKLSEAAHIYELLLAMVFVSDPIKKTLPVTLTYFVGPYATNYVQMFAAIIIAIAPTVIVYCMFSNQIVEGLTTGAVKG